MNSRTPYLLANGAKRQKKSAHSRRGYSPRAGYDTNGPEGDRLRAALHGGLGQLLTSISFLASTLRQKLAAQKLPEAVDAGEILALTGQAISETQALVQTNETPMRALAQR